MTEYDVSDIDPTTMFPKDCCYYNGGTVAPLEVTQYWTKDNEDEMETNQIEPELRV